MSRVKKLNAKKFMEDWNGLLNCSVGRNIEIYLYKSNHLADFSISDKKIMHVNCYLQFSSENFLEDVSESNIWKRPKNPDILP